MKQNIKRHEFNPQQLFLIDAFGALLSAFLLGIILVKYELIFGIPSSTLYFLAALPLVFIAYDIYSYFNEANKQSKLLKGISIINTSYCLLSLTLAIYHYESITNFGWLYIIIEILIVLSLAFIQYNVAKKYASNLIDP